MTGPVTLADLHELNRLLQVWCRCGHRAELPADALGLAMSTPVPGIERHLRCSACGARNSATDHPVKALMDPRQKGLTVSYPAF